MISNFLRLLRLLTHLRARDKVARVPRMFATDFTSYDATEARIMARYGIRSPSGLKRALRAADVDSVDELVNILEHHKTRRRVGYRLLLMLRRATGGTPYDPHQHEIRRAMAARRDYPELTERLKRLKTL